MRDERRRTQKSSTLWGRAAWLVVFIALTTAGSTIAQDRSREKATRIAQQIKRADYEGDRAALKTRYEELATFQDNKEYGAPLHYWRGFALWRRAINGFNDKVDPAELQEDLKQAINEFENAVKVDNGFVDAKIGLLSCQGFLAYSVRQQNPADPQIQNLLVSIWPLWKDTAAAAPDNPRLLWVIGPMVWNIPPERGGGQEKAIEGYKKGLETIRNSRTISNDPLQPSWGEPELLMSLAWSNLNRATPDLDAAEQDARSALKQVPYWHYVRDILMPQIAEAKRRKEQKDAKHPAVSE